MVMTAALGKTSPANLWTSSGMERSKTQIGPPPTLLSFSFVGREVLELSAAALEGCT